MRRLLITLTVLIAIDGQVTTVIAQNSGARKFTFGAAATGDDAIHITTATRYTDVPGFGFEGGGRGEVTARSAAGAQPFFFSVKVPEGNYRVSVTTGELENDAVTTVRAELRRLMVETVRTVPGEFKRSEFVVNVRRPAIAGGGEVRLKDRERTSEWRAWDDRLTLEFGGARPAVAAIEIEPVSDLPVLYLIGDSTVCDQPVEPYASWGQMLTRFFKSTIAVANHAESGESFRSSQGAGRFTKIFNQMKAGDYLIMQFGHNDMKAVDEASYAASIREVVATCRAKGGIPIVVSPMERRGFDDNGKIRDSLRGFPDAARKTAEELGVAFIDLHVMSKVLYETLGPEKAPIAFALAGGQRDGTHHNNYGSYQLAKCMVDGIQRQAPDLARHLIEGLTTFDPARPDEVESFSLAPSGDFGSAPPDGN